MRRKESEKKRERDKEIKGKKRQDFFQLFFQLKTFPIFFYSNIQPDYIHSYGNDDVIVIGSLGNN